MVAVVAIGAIGLGGWFAWGQHLPLEQSVGAPPYGEAGRSPVDPLTIAELGGAKENYALIRSMDGLANLSMLTRDELAAFAEFGASRVRLGISRFDTGKAMVLLVQMPDERSARRAVDRLSALQYSYGFWPAGGGPRGVKAGVVEDRNPAQPGGRAHYQHDNIVVRVEFRGPRRGPAESRFFQVLATQARAVVPDD